MLVFGLPPVLVAFFVLSVFVFLISGAYFAYMFQGIQSVDGVDETVTDRDPEESLSQGSTEVNQ